MSRPSVQVPDDVLAKWRASPDLWTQRARQIAGEVSVQRFRRVVLLDETAAKVALDHRVTREAVRQSVAVIVRKMLDWPASGKAKPGPQKGAYARGGGRHA